jgi:hypothetical protein
MMTETARRHGRKLFASSRIRCFKTVLYSGFSPWPVLKSFVP